MFLITFAAELKLIIVATENAKKEKDSKAGTKSAGAIKPARKVSKKSNTKLKDKAVADKAGKTKKEEKPFETSKELNPKAITEPSGKRHGKEKASLKADVKKTNKKEGSIAIHSAPTAEAAGTSDNATSTNASVQKTTATDLKAEPKLIKVTFQLKYTTRFGQRLALRVKADSVSEEDLLQDYPLQYFNNDYWFASIDFPAEPRFNYKYILIREDGSAIAEAGNGRVVDPSLLGVEEVLLSDLWNVRSTHENNLYSTSEVYARASPEKYTHIFKARAQALPQDYAIFITGSSAALGMWTEENIMPLTFNTNEGEWTINLNLEDSNLVEYKYGIFDVEDKKVVQLEVGDNRTFYSALEPKKLTIISDGFIQLAENQFQMAI